MILRMEGIFATLDINDTTLMTQNIKGRFAIHTILNVIMLSAAF
jgi:hypothetical protein